MARDKIQVNHPNGKVRVELGDAEQLKYADQSFDAVSVTYGIRNFEDLKKGLSEILRVLNDGGQCVILETSVPSNFIMKQGYLFYTKFIMPQWGRLFSKDKKAYSYLSDSALNFPYGEKMKNILLDVGFSKVNVLPQAGGISTIYEAYR